MTTSTARQVQAVNRAGSGTYVHRWRCGMCSAMAARFSSGGIVRVCFAVTLVFALLTSLNAQQMLTTKQMRDDLRFMVRTIERVHPNPYAYTSRSAVRAQIREARRRMRTPLSDTDFAVELAKIVASLHDAHTNVTVPKHSSELLLPVNLARSNGKIVIVRALDPAASQLVGAEVISINGQDITDIWRELASITSGEREPWIDAKVGEQLRYSLRSMFKIEAPFVLTLVCTSGEHTQLRLDGMTYRETLAALNIGTDPPYTFRMLPGQIGLIDYRSCEEYDRFSHFLQDVFSQLKVANAKALIVDVRRNGGGNSALNTRLVDYITAKPWREMSGRTKVSREVKAWLDGGIFKSGIVTDDSGTRELLRKEYEYVAGCRDGKLIESTDDVLQPTDNPLRFHGPVFLLTSATTFSSAADLAATIKDNRLGTIVGEETGGLASSYGDIYEFRLPNSGIAVDVSYKYFLRPARFDDHKGVIPDVMVTADDALDRALEIIKQ